MSDFVEIDDVVALVEAVNAGRMTREAALVELERRAVSGPSERSAAADAAADAALANLGRGPR